MSLTTAASLRAAAQESAVIERVEAIPLRIPRERTGPFAGPGLPDTSYFRAPHRGLVYAEHHETLYLKITASNGVVGWGEALASVAPEIGAQVVRSLIAPQLIGRDPLAIDAIWTDLFRSMRDRGHHTGFFIDALAGCDTSLWDLRGKVLGQPVTTLLGGPYATQIRVYASGAPGKTPEERAASAMQLVDDGFDAIKLHLHSGGRDTVATVQAVRDAVGPDVALMVDAHNVFDVAEAIKVARELERFDVLFFEAPTDPENVAGLAAIAAATQVRIATGESERSRFQFRDRLVARAVEVVQPDLGYVGVSEMRRIAALAEAFHVPMAPHLSAGLGSCIAATLHLAAAIPNFLILECSLSSLAMANRLLRQPLRLSAGRMTVPEGPGLGADPDEAALRSYEVPL